MALPQRLCMHPKEGQTYGFMWTKPTSRGLRICAGMAAAADGMCEKSSTGTECNAPICGAMLQDWFKCFLSEKLKTCNLGVRTLLSDWKNTSYHCTSSRCSLTVLVQLSQDSHMACPVAQHILPGGMCPLAHC
jgi:hypothetical protein